MQTCLFSRLRRSALGTSLGGIFCVLVFLGGCSQSDRLPTYPVRGNVTFPDGAPIGLSTIIFESREHPLAATGVVEEDGSFTLGTYEEDDGAVAGNHVVTITPMPPEDFDPDANRRLPPPIDPDYMHPDRSGLEFEVTEDGPNLFQIQIQRRR